MKRFIIVCFCLSLFALLFIPSFAVDIPSADFFTSSNLRSISPSSSYDSLTFYRSNSYIPHVSTDFTFDVSGTVVLGGRSYSFSSIVFSSNSSEPVLRAFTSSSSLVLISPAGSFNYTSWDGILSFDFPFSFPSNFVSWYNSFPSPDLDGSVLVGVSTSIGWFGNVLTNLVTSTNILPLVGLAVALFVIIPFGITTIKNLMKGY